MKVDVSKIRPENLRSVALAMALMPRARERDRLECSLIDFVEAAWPTLDSAEYQRTWAIEALCDHLQAVASGDVKHLLVNFPPRCGKTLIASVCFPAWIWAQRSQSFLTGSSVKFLCGSYNDDLSLMNATAHRRLLVSPWYQKYWGSRYKITLDQNTKSKFDTSLGGSRRSTSARGSLLGVGGDYILIDDPHNTKQAESEAERAQALTWWREISTTRLNDPKRSPIVVIMQRLHEEDVSGVILSSGWSSDWTHLCIPMEYEWRRHCVTSIGWRDPRGVDDDDNSLVAIGADGERSPVSTAAEVELEKREGELMWPERFGAAEIARIKAELGPYMASGRLQQSPMPAKGGIFDRGWWQLWDPPDGKFPPFDYIVASVDSAFTAKEQNDPTGFTMWGVFWDGGKTLYFSKPDGEQEIINTDGHRRIMLIKAWRKHLPFSGPRIERGEHETWAMYRARTSSSWGLIEWIYDSVSNHTYKPGHPRHIMCNKILIEAKASGISAAQELCNRFRVHDTVIQPCGVKGDKVARALAVQPMFSQYGVYAPNRPWSDGPDGVITEMASFPMGRYDDLTDSATQALKHLRDIGLGQSDVEVEAEEREALTYRPKPKPLYPI